MVDAVGFLGEWIPPYFSFVYVRVCSNLIYASRHCRVLGMMLRCSRFEGRFLSVCTVPCQNFPHPLPPVALPLLLNFDLGWLCPGSVTIIAPRYPLVASKSCCNCNRNSWLKSQAGCGSCSDHLPRPFSNSGTCCRRSSSSGLHTSQPGVLCSMIGFRDITSAIASTETTNMILSR